ncbi:hypothetical protein [Paenibacillus thermotolerans]|uniref:hypothetical protein n=1 Tax=Paenibacillus thermotolerans TaxID=3027807 RepID=UPI002368DC6A|nr:MULTISPECIES: hypothetical protein [unclassified Paenibacillus]
MDERERKERRKEQPEKRVDDRQAKGDRQDQLEQMIEKTLTVGEMESVDPEEGAKALLGTRYEIPVKAEFEPIAEETKIIRSMAKEPDDRYDKWAERGNNTK